jgi:hypothetical protein
MGGKYRAARTKRWWRGLAAAGWVLTAVVCSAVMHWTLRRDSMDRAEERLVSMCEERARMLQEQFGVTVNHVHAIAILISTFNFEKSPPAIDQVRNHSPPPSSPPLLLYVAMPRHQLTVGSAMADGPPRSCTLFSRLSLSFL